MASATNSGHANATTISYRKLDHREHVLLRPGMYVGSVEPDVCAAWTYDPERGAMERRTMAYVPALLKIFDEIVVNAVDHSIRLKEMAKAGADVQPVRNIRVSIDRATGLIELIFGHLLTSANYDDGGGDAGAGAPGSEGGGGGGRIVGGQNGIGAKACNIFSRSFQVETIDRSRKRIYTQAFGDNMSRADPPVIKPCARKPCTTIRFMPDYARFGMPDGLTDDMYALLVKRVYDITAVTDSDIAVHLNGAKLEVKTFERYVDLYLGPKTQVERAYERVNDWWEVAAACSDGNGLQQVSFVNGIWTLRGGKHVDHVVNQIARRLTEMIQEKRKESGAGVRPQFIKDNLFVFVRATVPNPTFDSQSKDTLTTPVARFGCKVELSDKFIEKLYKSPLVERVVTLSEATMDKTLKKTDGKKQSTLRGIPKLDDANWAGTAKSAQCTLILTEGDSAKTMVLAGIDQVGRDRYGVFPLRGKIMNVCDMTAARIADNQEIVHLKKILGLEAGREYKDASGLRYGRIMVMTDQDTDGSHIKGLLINLFQQLWPSLLKVDGFLTSMLTPIVKAKKGQAVHSFYNLSDFHAWREGEQLRSGGGSGGMRGWEVKYYKGLGTSTPAEAKEYFRKLKIVCYKWDGGDDACCKDAIDLAFNKKRANDRKEWLLAYDREATLDYGRDDVAFHEFVHRDLVHFSNYDVVRSIPSVVDGLKISQRKIMFGCFKRGLVKEVRVAQLAGYVSEHAAYHHGEASLNATIVGLAQDFVGSNNVNLLLPNGQFGSRRLGGKDSGAPRYIHTALNPTTSLLFVKDDEAVLNYLDDDGVPVEPEFYVPVLPLVLINGAIGIGTGFSTNVPCYDPEDVAAAVRTLLEHDDSTGDDAAAAGAGADADADLASRLPQLRPWYRGFTGTIEVDDATGKCTSRGVYKRLNNTQVQITELPVGMWTDDFKELVEAALDNVQELRSADHNHTDTRVNATLTFASKAALDAWLLRGHGDASGSDAAAAACKLEREFKLVSNRFLSTQNMYLFSAEGRIKKYASVRDILVDFYRVRLETYAKRKERVLRDLRARMTVLTDKVRFVQGVVDGEIVVQNVRRADLEAALEAQGFERLGAGSSSSTAAATEEQVQENAGGGGGGGSAAEGVGGSFDHLVRMPIYSLTMEKKLELEAQLAGLQQRCDLLEATSIKDMWRAELDAFLAAYRKGVPPSSS